MAEVLLTSERSVKDITNISDNLAGKFILPAIREAQDMGLKSIVGDTLLAKLKSLVADGSISQPANAIYKSCLDQCGYYLTYKAVSEVLYKVAYKVANGGVVRNTDEKIAYASKAEVDAQVSYYEAKADRYCVELQNWLLRNQSSLPELTQNHCHRIKANLRSAASCGIFLGGARGKSIEPLTTYVNDAEGSHQID